MPSFVIVKLMKLIKNCLLRIDLRKSKSVKFMSAQFVSEPPLRFQAYECHAAVLFVDLSGYSKITAIVSALLVFHLLKSALML